jgi:hypothetical protein
MMSTIKNVKTSKSREYLVSIVRFTDEAINELDENNIVLLD